MFAEYFGPVKAPVHHDVSGFSGADVVMATGWQTVHRVLRLPGARARAYLVQDHEPEFFGTSAERTWSQETYGLGLHCICASPWLAALDARAVRRVRRRRSTSASTTTPTSRGRSTVATTSCCSTPAP